MARKLFRKYLPQPDVVFQSRWIKLLGPRLQEPSLWHINRRSCSIAVAVGVFCAFIPVPFQMLIAAACSIWLRANILVAVPVVWVSNPFTIGPLFYVCYLFGVELLGLEPKGFDFELSTRWLIDSLGEIWQPFLLGCFVLGLFSATASFVLVRTLWHWYILNHIRARARRIHNRRRHTHGKF